MKTKLTLVSVFFNNRRFSIFVNAPIIQKKAVVSQSLINSMLEKLGCNERGLTYSVS